MEHVSEPRETLSEEESAVRERRDAGPYLDIAGVMFLELDDTGRISRINRKGCEVLGGSESDLVGMSWLDTFVPADVRDEVTQWYRSLMSGDAELHAHAKNAIVTLGGEERVIEWDNALLRDESGAVTGTLSSGLDVTESERATQTQRVIHEIWNAAVAARDTRELFSMIHRHLGTILNAQNFFIAMYDSKTDSLSLSYFVDEKDQDSFDSFPAGKTMTGYVVRNNTSLMLSREEADKWVEAGILDIVGSPSEIWLGVPLRVRGEVIGALVLQSYTNVNEYGPADRDMLEFISGQIGFAIERKRTEIDLRTSEQRNRAIIDAVPDLMFQFDKEGRFLMYESPSDDELALPPDAFVGKGVGEVLPPDLAVRVEAALEKVLSSGETQMFEYDLPIPMPDGELRTFEARMVPSGNETVLTVVRDITERKRAEDMLRALNKASLAMEQTLTPEEVVDVASRQLMDAGLNSVVANVSEDGDHIVPVNLCFPEEAIKEVLSHTDLSPGEPSVRISESVVLKRTIRDRESVYLRDAMDSLVEMLPDTTDDVRRALVESLNLRQSIQAPLIADNSVFGLLVVHSAHLQESDTPAVTAFANQLAAALRKASLLEQLEASLEELKQTQDQLLQAQKMEAVGRLAGGVAHDFNNLLTAIKGYAELLAGDPDTPESVREDVIQIRKAADQAAGLTRQLLAFSRRQPLQRRVIDLNKVVSEMDAMLRRLIGEDIELLSDLHDEIRIKADPGQVEQVVINLVVNARDAMPEGGRLSVKTKAVILDEEACSSLPGARPGWFACISIEDTGAGIPRDVLDQIFEPFFSTKGPGKGTGLGLAVVYGIVRQHDGWINVYREPRHGTVFKIYLPAADGETEPESDGPGEGRELRGSNERILLVEDERTVREFATRALEQSGYTVVAAADAEEALRIFQKENGGFSLVFSDVVLPDKSGIRLVEELAAEWPGVRAMLTSGYTDQKSQWPTIEQKGYCFLQKPYSLPELLSAVRNAISDEHETGAGREESDHSGDVRADA